MSTLRVKLAGPNSIANSYSSAKEMAAARSQGIDVDHGWDRYYASGGTNTPRFTTTTYRSSASSGSSGSAALLPALAEGVSLPTSSSMSSYLDLLSSIQAQNNAWSASQAEKQMDFQRSEADRAMKFNHDEAELSRQWTQMMSDTAHQREVKDLQAAGLNPVLSAYGGNGAPVTSGAVASGYSPGQGAKGDTDTSLSSALVHLLGSSMSAMASMSNMALSARTQESVADKYTAMSELVAGIQRDTSLSVANINSMASMYAADKHVDASRVSAAITAAAHRYGYDVMAMSNETIARFNAEVNRLLQNDRIEADFNLHDAYPTSMAGLFSSLLGNLIQPGQNKGASAVGSLTSLLGKTVSSFFDGFFR